MPGHNTHNRTTGLVRPLLAPNGAHQCTSDSEMTMYQATTESLLADLSCQNSPELFLGHPRPSHHPLLLLLRRGAHHQHQITLPLSCRLIQQRDVKHHQGSPAGQLLQAGRHRHHTQPSPGRAAGPHQPGAHLWNHQVVCSWRYNKLVAGSSTSFASS